MTFTWPFDVMPSVGDEPVSTDSAIAGFGCGTIGPSTSDHGPVPSALVALTRNQYWVPSVSPVCVRVVNAVLPAGVMITPGVRKLSRLISTS